jgi:hypothetical protein
MRAAALLMLAACGGGDTYVVITVDSRPAVHDATDLRVTLTNGGATLTNDLPLGGHTFPVTFSLSSPSAAGDITIGVEALGSDTSVVGFGSQTTALDAGTASIMLEAADFVVNTEFPMDQFLGEDYRQVGQQLAALPDGTWTVAFHDNCGTAELACNQYARMFDVNGAPVSTEIGAGTNQFDITTNLTYFLSEQAAAAGSAKTLVLWDAHDMTSTPSVDEIGCRPLDAGGNSPDFETDFAFEPETEIVSGTPLESGNFAVVWDSEPGSDADQVIRSQVIGPDCSPIGSPITLSQGSAFDLPSRSAVASVGANVLYAWINNSDVHVRGASTGNVTSTGDLTLVPHTATTTMEHVRVLPAGDQFAVFVRSYSESDETAPGSIQLYLVQPSGIVMGSPVTITDAAESDASSSVGFAVAEQSDGKMLVVWNACGAGGDGAGCGVSGQLVAASGDLVGSAFVIPTTITGDQTNPAAAALPGGAFAVAWNDASATPPDTQGLAVRARIIYPGK